LGEIAISHLIICFELDAIRSFCQRINHQLFLTWNTPIHIKNSQDGLLFIETFDIPMALINPMGLESIFLKNSSDEYDSEICDLSAPWRGTDSNPSHAICLSVLVIESGVKK
jgi:hypothetical protein